MSNYLADQIAVVTGAANGIGRAIAIRLAAEGAAVVALDRETDGLTELAAAIAAAGGTAHTIALDLTDRAVVTETFAHIARDIGAIDVLVNNVGQAARERGSAFWCSEPEVWDFVIGISLMTTIHCSRQVAPAMRERQRGKIVSIASDSAFTGDLMIADYCAAKAGVIGFTRALAREMAPLGVNVNAVAPGPTRTRAAERSAAFALSQAQIPMGRVGEPEDIANAVAFLSTEQSRFITGQVLVVDGGRIFH